MSITSVFVGSLQQGGGGLDWQEEAFPKRTLSWDGTPIEETFTVPGDKGFIAYATVYIFPGGDPSGLFALETEAKVSYASLAEATTAVSGQGNHTTGMIGIQSDGLGRKLRVRPSPGYHTPDITYQVSIWWAELPE